MQGIELQKPQIIRTQGLTKTYRGTPVVDGVELQVGTGEVFGFLGPNGAGKSTTMKMLLGLVRPTSGRVEIFDQNLARNQRMILPRIGSLIESPSFYGHLTGPENLDLVRRIKGLAASTVTPVLATVGLSGQEKKQVKNYSLGMKQRLGLAMALLGEPNLLILDEPTNGLDPAGIQEMRDLIVGLPERFGMTVLVSSHLLSEIEQMASTVGIIDHGRLLYQGPLSGLEDAGRLVVTVSEPSGAASMLRQAGWQIQHVSGNELTLPVYANEQIAELVSTLVSSSFQVFRVEVRRRPLEQVFLEMTSQNAHLRRAS